MKKDFILVIFITTIIAFFIGKFVGEPTHVEKNHIAEYTHLKEVCEARKTFIVAQQAIIDRVEVTGVQDDCYKYLKDKCDLDYDY